MTRAGTLRWLHLSDLHLGCRGRELWWQVQDEFQRDLRGWIERLGPPDLLLLSGDLTFSGSGVEFDLVDRFLDDLLGWIRQAGGGSEPLLLAVPGNHDLAWPRGKDARSYRILDDYGRGADDDGVRDLVEELWTKRDPSFVQPLFAPYLTWLERRVLPGLSRPGVKVHRSHFPGDFTATLDLPGRFPLCIVGLNSTWLQWRKGEFEGRLEVPAEQFQAALPAAGGSSPLAVFQTYRHALLMLHHPLAWLSDKGRQVFREQIYRPDRFHLCLHGHLHEAKSRSVSEGGGSPRHYFQSPSLFGVEHYGTAREKRAVGYTWGSLSPEGELHLWPLLRKLRGDDTGAFDWDSFFHGDLERGCLLRPPDRPGPAVARSTPSRPRQRPGRRVPPADEEHLADYVTWAREQHRGMSLIGVGGGDLRLRFDEVYVPLRLFQLPAAAEERPGKRAGLSEVAAGEDFEVEAIFSPAFGGRHVILFGDPGAGKTTALLKLHHQVLAQGPESLGLPPGTLPVFLRLRRAAPQDLRESPEAFLQRQLDAASDGKLPADLGQRLWKRGSLLLLLDGLDEIADEGLRAAACDFLELHLPAAERRQVRAVLSCRSTYADQVQVGERFLRCEVRPLDSRQCRALVERWFEEAPRALPHYPQEEARSAARKLIAALDGPGYASQSWKVLVGSPLLLTLLCVIVLRGGEMPRHRVAFFDHSLRVLLGQWDRSKAEAGEPPREPPLDVETALAVLRELAYELHTRERRGEMVEWEVILCIEERLNRLGKPDSGLQVFEWLHRGAGVVRELAPAHYGFLHLGIQEYLVALHVAGAGEDLLDELAQRFGSEGWREVPLLLVGLPGYRLFAPLMERLLRNDALFEQADLLRACLEEAAEPDLEPFFGLLEAGVEPARQAAVLRLLRGQFDPRLRERAATLVDSANTDVAALAAQIVATAQASAAPAEFDVLVVHHPEEAASAAEFEGALRRQGLRVAVRAGDAVGKESFLQPVRGVAMVIGPAGRAPWQDRNLECALRLLSSRRRLLVPVQLPGSGTRPALPADLPAAPWLDLHTGLARAADAWERALHRAEAPAFEARPAAPGTATPGETFVETVTGMKLLWIPGGRFRMGGDAYPIEQPVHEVQVSPFWLGETPVTNRQYAVFLEATGLAEPAYWRARRFSAPDQPVVGVSWHDAHAFCRWLAETTGRKFQLPSEAQWEFAARGTDGRPYPWGDEPPDPARACFGLSGEKGQPAPVGSYPAGKGPFGTLDQAGNVWEWCRDAWGHQIYAKRSGAGAPVDPVVEGNEDSERGLRGGGWFNPADYLRAAYRYWFPARLRSIDIGFRVAAVPASL